jgi:hypothetical protein
MPTAAPSLGVIRAQIRAIRNKAQNARVFGIYSPGRWSGPSVHGEGDEQIAIYQCDSPLEMRLAIQDAPKAASATVLVTPLEQTKVNDDILVRMALRRLHPINNWEIIRSLFKAKQLDPRITRHAFLADHLLEHLGTYDFPPVAGGLVDAETVWGILLKECLGLSGARPDLVELLRCASESDLPARWRLCAPEFRTAATEWISEHAGDTARLMLQCLKTDHGEKVLAIGLAMDVVYHPDVGHELDKAAGRLESYVGIPNLPVEDALRWRDAAAAAANFLAHSAYRRCHDEAETILENIGATAHAWRSEHLESGFEQRLSRFGHALTAQLDAKATAISDELQSLYASAEQHRLGRDDGRRIERAAMALRLARWLGDRRSDETSVPVGITSLAQRYAANSGFVDWARQVLRGGEPNKNLAEAYVHVVNHVTEHREEENRRFGHALAERRAEGAVAERVIPVEQLIEQVVAKAAEIVPVLVLLVDGMNWAVFRELVSDIKSRDWIELGFGATPERLMGLAALPSVTEVCRTSLFCGKLKRGQAADEVNGFANHPALTRVSQASFAPRLFHKAALEGDEDSSLSGKIRTALANKKLRVVGVVINAVDDHLDKGDQIDVIWTMRHIRVLEPILAEANAAGRLVVLLSDHGHVLDRQTEYREGEDGSRWRRPGGSVSEGEIEIESSRVAMPDGGRIVVPWSERLRYGAKKNGYHGGATPQEMLIPVSLLWPELRPPEGLEELPADTPPWWIEPAAPPVAAPVAGPPKPKAKKLEEPTLFDQPAAVPPTAAAPWITELFKSAVFASQKQRVGRVRIEESTIERFIEALASRGGTMTVPALAGVTATPEHRLPGLLAIMQRLLNVEGYSILDRQEVANTVVLNIPLLKKQFEILTA